MPTIIKIIPRQDSGKKSGIPVTIRWKGVPMVRSHSINKVAHQLMIMSKNQDYIAINIIGKQSTGKTELCRTLAHLIHDFSKIPYNVDFFTKDDLLDLENTIKRLTPTNHIVIFEDVSFLKANATPKQIDTVQSVLSVIRHLNEGDFKIILFKNFHYTKAIPPFLRQNDMTFLSSVDDSEIKNLEEMFGKKNSMRILQLKDLRNDVINERDFKFPIGRKGIFSYKPKDPFLPYLMSDGSYLRFIVSPLRTWIEPFCQTCSPAKQSTETKQNLEQFVNGFNKSFGKGVCKKAVELKLMQAGITTQTKRVLQALKHIEQFFNEKEINLEELSLAYNLTPRETKLFPDKQLIIMEAK